MQRREDEDPTNAAPPNGIGRSGSRVIDKNVLGPRVLGRRIGIGVTAGIASYKICSVVSALAQAGAEVTVAMTADAQRFVTPLVFQSLSGRPVLASIWDESTPADPQHIRIATTLDLFLVAPCTMDMAARIATGRCDDIVSLLVASIDRARTPVLVAPSMNDAMWRQPSTQRNIATLRADGFRVIEPASGWQACRTVGTGRLPEADQLLDEICDALARCGRSPAEADKA